MCIMFIESRFTIICPLFLILTIFFLPIFEFKLIDGLVFLKRFSDEISVLLWLRDRLSKFVLLEFDTDSLIFLLFRHGSFSSTLASYIFKEVGNMLAI